MRKKTPLKPIAAAVGVAVAGTMLMAGSVSAAGNPFALNELGSGYMQVANEGKCGGSKGAEKAADGKCGAGKCGGSKGAEKAADGKCGTGKCGGSKGAEKAADGKCGAGKCGSGTGAEKAADGKCGAGKCGGSK